MDHPASLEEHSNANERTLSASSELISNTSWLPDFTTDFSWQNNITDVFIPNNATEASAHNRTTGFAWQNITSTVFGNLTADSNTTDSDFLMDAVDPYRQRYQDAVEDLNRNPAYNNYNGDPFNVGLQNSPLIDEQQNFYPTSYNPVS